MNQIEKAEKGKGIRALGKTINTSVIGSLAGLVILIIISSVATKGNFLQVRNLTNVMRQVTILGFAAIGQTLVILTGSIDLSIIGNVSMTTVLTAVFMQMELPTPLIFLLVILAGMCVGVVNGVILNIWRIEAFVVTMGMQVVCFGLALLFAESRTVIVDGTLLESKYQFIKNMASARLFQIPVMFLIMLVFFAIFYIFTTKTKLGRLIHALGGSEEVCYMSGINVSFVRALTYVLSGIMAAIAGIFMFSRTLSGDPAAGNSLGMYVVAAVVVGGTKMSGGRGNVLFTITGIFIIQIINNTLNLMNAPYQLQQIVQGVIILVAVIISSSKRR